MKILLYFYWMGSRKEVKGWATKIMKACEETGVEYFGLYGTMNQKWHYTAMFDATSYDEFLKMAWKVPRPQYMTHYIHELLIEIRV